MGLVNLDYIEEIMQKRKTISNRYDEKLKGLRIQKQKWHKDSKNNFAYYPILFESEEMMLKSKSYLEKHEIFTRRYFYPSLATTLPYLEPKTLPITDDVVKRILCLPLYTELISKKLT